MRNIARYCLFVLLVFTLLIGVSISSHNSGHHHGHKGHHLRSRHSIDPERTVEDALVRIRQANKYRVNHPRRNNYSFSYENTPEPPPHLFQAENSSTVSPTEYPISAEVIRAAALLAESREHVPLGQAELATAQHLKDRYWGTANDTRTNYGSDGLLKRDETTFWMESMDMNGESPLAPSGYKVRTVYEVF